MEYEIVGIRDNLEYLESGIKFFSDNWGIDEKIYDNCIRNSISTEMPLPRWYLLKKNDELVGSYGLITNDFISRQDLYPWLAALFIKKEIRNKGLGGILLNHGRKEAYKLGYKKVFLCTSHIGYYEKYQWKYIGIGYHLWNEESRIYEIESIKE
jgi:GNAT superfamily N-acetyltransferase